MHMPGMVQKEKIAILGGGIGALTCAYELTNIPNWQDRYEVKVYQQAWRLGGKGASARNPEHYWRIEEHGPHVWFGFYFNAFRVVDDAYQYCVEHQLLPEGSFMSWQEAFQPKDNAVVLDYVRDRWLWWTLNVPRRPGLPTQPSDTNLWSLIGNGLNMLVEHRQIIRNKTRISEEYGPFARLLLCTHSLMARLSGHRSNLPRLGPGTLLRDLHAYLRTELERIESGRARILGRFGVYVIDSLLARFIGIAHRAVRDVLPDEPDIRHAWEILDMGVAILRGILADNVLIDGLDAIEDWDFSRWLEKHGCFNPWSPLIRSIYDSGAHYENGQTVSSKPNERPATANLAAGTAVHCLLRMFAGYAGSFSYRMNAGMGETVFTPIYLALRHRGVKFAFFHRVKRLELNEKKDAVEAINLDVQANVSAGPFSYQPLLPAFRGLLCWPNHPCFAQLTEGPEIQKTGADLESAWCDFHVGVKRLELGEHFDKVVLGISIAGLAPICSELCSVDGRWQGMLKAIKTVQTQFLQIWMTCPTNKLCECSASIPMAEGFIEPIDTWLDMSQVGQREGWPHPPGSVHYFIGALSEESATPIGRSSVFPASQRKRVFENFRNFIDGQILKLWPLACIESDQKRFDWNLMRGPDGLQGANRLQSQYYRANVDPTDRYVLSVAGSKRHRMRSDDSGFANLFLAGDWTLNGINGGSVEAAVMSGMQASQGISGYPHTIAGGWGEMSRTPRT
jgi:uncharacterized protein with NAD-binding domain and iron-sulfur cluster